MPASVFDYAAIQARLDELGERQHRIPVVDDQSLAVELLTEFFEQEGWLSRWLLPSFRSW